MPEVVTKYLNLIKEKWTNFDKSQKIRVILSLAIVLVSIVLAVFFVVNPNYQEIVSGSVAEIGEMSKILTESNISHKLEEKNTKIIVKEKDLDAAQIALAQSGYLDSSNIKLSDSLDMITFSTTESDKREIYKEHYENKLATQLKKMSNIQDAVVNLSIPEKSIFIGSNEEDKPTASVMVTPKGTLTEAQIEGIAALVAASVERLDKKDVTIIDNSGNALSEFDSANSLVSNKQLQLQAQKKSEIEKQVAVLLADMTDSVKVAANIVCDFDQETATSIEYSSPNDSDTGIVRSEQTIKENVQNMDTSAIPGTDSNQGTGAMTASIGQTGTYKREEATSNYEINEVRKSTVKGLGNIDTTRSSITVNLLYGVKFVDEPSEEILEKVTKMVSNATGILESRVTVVSSKLLPPEPINTSIDWASILEKYAPYLAAIIILAIMSVFVLNIKKTFTEKDNSGLDLQMAGANIDYTVGDDDSIKELDNNSEVKQQITAFIDKQPDIAAGMLRNWLYENEKNPNS